MGLNFPCDKCGACCHYVGQVPVMKSYDRGDGICKHLLPDNGCEIYETRPDICNVEKMFRTKWCEDYTWDEYVEQGVKFCERFKLEKLPQP